jgi:hypothetical protein
MFKLKKKNILFSILIVMLLLDTVSASSKDKKMAHSKPIILGAMEISVQVNDEMKWRGPIPVRIEKVIGAKIPKNESSTAIWVIEPPLEIYPKDPGPAPEGMRIEYIPQDIRVESMIIKKNILEVVFVNDDNKTQTVQVEAMTGKIIYSKVHHSK